MISKGEGRAVAISMVLRRHNPTWQLQRISRQKLPFGYRPRCGRFVATCGFLKAATYSWGSEQLQLGHFCLSKLRAETTSFANTGGW
jgi:hypothetical protein